MKQINKITTRLYDNYIFNSLEVYMERVFDAVLEDINKVTTFIPLHCENSPIAISFLFDENIDEMFFIQHQKNLEGKLPSSKEFVDKLLDKGFFILQPYRVANKPSMPIGKLYTINFCFNNTKIVSKNLLRCGFLFTAPKECLYKFHDYIFVCKQIIENSNNQSNDVTLANYTLTQGKDFDQSKRLIEIVPKVFLLVNSTLDKQALILNTNQ